MKQSIITTGHDKHGLSQCGGPCTTAACAGPDCAAQHDAAHCGWVRIQQQQVWFRCSALCPCLLIHTAPLLLIKACWRGFIEGGLSNPLNLPMLAAQREHSWIGVHTQPDSWALGGAAGRRICPDSPPAGVGECPSPLADVMLTARQKCSHKHIAHALHSVQHALVGCRSGVRRL